MRRCAPVWTAPQKAALNLRRNRCLMWGGAGYCFGRQSNAGRSSIGKLTIEASPAIRAVGSDLARHSGLTMLDWRAGDVVRERLEFPYADLVTIAYVLDELAPDEREKLIERLWASARQMFVIVEPGTPGRLAAHPRCTQGSDRQGRLYRRAMPARAGLPAGCARLVPFLAARGAVSYSSHDEGCGSAVGGREIRSILPLCVKSPLAWPRG